MASSKLLQLLVWFALYYAADRFGVVRAIRWLTGLVRPGQFSRSVALHLVEHLIALQAVFLEGSLPTNKILPKSRVLLESAMSQFSQIERESGEFVRRKRQIERSTWPHTAVERKCSGPRERERESQNREDTTCVW